MAGGSLRHNATMLESPFERKTVLQSTDISQGLNCFGALLLGGPDNRVPGILGVGRKVCDLWEEALPLWKPQRMEGAKGRVALSTVGPACVRGPLYGEDERRHPAVLRHSRGGGVSCTLIRTRCFRKSQLSRAGDAFQHMQPCPWRPFLFLWEPKAFRTASFAFFFFLFFPLVEASQQVLLETKL